MIKKELKTQLEVGASADAIWAVYSSPDLPKYLLQKLLPGAFEKVEILKGDGGVGTVLLIQFPPGAVPRSYEEKFVTVDNERRLKEVVMVKGGYLDMGCTFYMDTVHVIPKGPNSCVIASKVNYEVANEEAEKKVAPYISTGALEAMANVISNYVINKATNKLLHEFEVAASAKNEYWEVYNSLDHLPKLILNLLPSVFRDVDVQGKDVRITIPPGMMCSVPGSNEENFVSWCGRKSFKYWFVCLISAVTYVFMVFLSSRIIAEMI